MSLPTLTYTKDSAYEEFLFEIHDKEFIGMYFLLIFERDSQFNYDAYAQIVDDDELDELMGIDVGSPEVEDPEQIAPYTSNYLRRTRRVDD